MSTFPRFVEAGSGRRVIVYSEAQLQQARAEGEDGPFPVYLPDGAAVVYSRPVEPSKNQLFNPPEAVEPRMFKRGPGRPPGSKNKR